MSYKGPDGGDEDMQVQLACLRWLNLCMDHSTRGQHMGVKNKRLFENMPSKEDLVAACLPESYNEGQLRRARQRQPPFGPGLDVIKPALASAKASSSSSASSGSSSSSSD